MIKKYFFGALLFCVFSFPSYAKTAAHLDKIIAIVNGDVITQSELDKRVTMLSHRLPGVNSNTPKPSALRKLALDSLIDTLLQIQLAKNSGMQISDTEIDTVISNIAKNNHLTVEQLKQTLQEHEGLSFKEYREQLHDQIIVGRVQQQALGRDIAVSEQEIQKVLRNPPKINNNAPAQYHVADILIALPDNASPDQIKAATATANKVSAKLKQEADIEKAIKEFDTPKQQVQSTDLGVRKIAELPPLFAQETIKMQVGQIAGPIKAPNGLHLLKLLEAQGAPPQNLKFTKERAQEFVFQQKLEKKLKPWLKELRDAAYVKIIE
jgi:peptidyl-prolyl cis-trans isomerase SurA